MPASFPDHRRPLLDLSIAAVAPPPPSPPPPQSPSGVITLSNTQALTVTGRGNGGAMLLVESQTAGGLKRFHLAVPLAQLPTLIDSLCAIEQNAIDRGQLPERDDGDAQP